MGQRASTMTECSFRLAGDTAIVVDFGNRIELQLNDKVLSLARRLEELQVDGVIECIPTIRSLTVQYEPRTLSSNALQELLAKILQDLPVAERSGKSWRLPLCYDPTLAPDLAYVADRTGLSPKQVVERHSATTYHVYM